MKKHLPFHLAIAILTLLAWHKIYFHTFLGEGYIYFRDSARFPVFGSQGNIENLFRYDNLARFLYYFLEKLIE